MEDGTAYKQARAVSQRKGRRARQARGCVLGRPATRPTAKEKKSAGEERRDWAKGREREADFRPKAEKENISFSFSFSNTSNTFSNNF
jgi:hypothetical protein